MYNFKKVMSWLLPILVGLAIALLIRQFWFTLMRVDGTSMEPNLVNNERVLVLRNQKINRGSVIVFNAKGADPSATTNRDYVKRVIGLPGDRISAIDGTLYVNDKKVNQDFIPQSEQAATNAVNNVGNWENLKELGTHMSWSKNASSFTVPNDEYFVLGDHRSVSNDSRYWGYVPKENVVGSVKLSFWNNAKTKSKINTESQRFFAVN
ncbi:signal peptidase I [Weissella kandleri]|nr:signal peptidase I [Weissella kandleri]